MTHPLRQLTIAEATQLQFNLVDLMHQHFDGQLAMEAGDYGAAAGLGRPRTTAMVESVLAELFGADDATLVAGAGTGSIRSALMGTLSSGARVVIHDVPVYATTSVTFRAMGLRLEPVDLNDGAARRTAFEQAPDMVYLQHSRQMLDDQYDIEQVIGEVRELAPDCIVMVDDNYTAMQVPRIGTQLGADLSAFSLFKLLGEPGVGCVVGRGDLIARLRDDAYSGGTKIQGPIALSTLRGVVQAPVMFALASEVVETVLKRVEQNPIPGVRAVHPGNHQERSLLVELDDPIAEDVINVATRFGAATHPVGSQSRFDTHMLVYRLSRAMCEAEPELARRMVRVSPFRAGPDTVIRVLTDAIQAAREQPGVELSEAAATDGAR
jgi:cystathionine beta-lyase/cystathionine gamma-synthase